MIDRALLPKSSFVCQPPVPLYVKHEYSGFSSLFLNHAPSLNLHVVHAKSCTDVSNNGACLRTQI